jgi:hypothetical protein
MVILPTMFIALFQELTSGMKEYEGSSKYRAALGAHPF